MRSDGLLGGIFWLGGENCCIKLYQNLYQNNDTCIKICIKMYQKPFFPSQSKPVQTIPIHSK